MWQKQSLRPLQFCPADNFNLNSFLSLSASWLSSLFIFWLFKTCISYFLKSELQLPTLSIQPNLHSISVYCPTLFLFPFSQSSFSSCTLCYSETCRYFSLQGLPCMTSLHSNANNVGQLWLSMQLCLCLQKHIQRHIVLGEIWVSQRSIPSGTASGR